MSRLISGAYRWLLPRGYMVNYLLELEWSTFLGWNSIALTRLPGYRWLEPH